MAYFGLLVGLIWIEKINNFDSSQAQLILADLFNDVSLTGNFY